MCMFHRKVLFSLIFLFSFVFFFSKNTYAQQCYPQGDSGCTMRDNRVYVCNCGAGGCLQEQVCAMGTTGTYWCNNSPSCAANSNPTCRNVGSCGGDCAATQVCRASPNGQTAYCVTDLTICSVSCSISGNGAVCGSLAGCPEGMFCNGATCVCNTARCGATGACADQQEVNPINQIGYTSFQYPITDFGGLISSITAVLFPAGIGLGFFMIIRAGYKYMISEGDPAKVKEAQEELTAAIIGTLFILLSVFILNTIISTVLGV